MKKRIVLCSAAAFTFMSVQPLLAGGIDNKHNWSAEYIRTLNRNAATDSADAVAYNPAGTMAMENGSYINLSGQYIGKTYSNEINGTDRDSGSESIVPGLFGLYKTNRWSAYAAFTIPGGGGKVEYDRGNATTMLAGLGITGQANTQLDANAATLAAAGIPDPGLLHYSATTSERLEAESYYYGYTLGGAYKINDMIAISAGVRFIDAHQESHASLTVSAADSALGTVPNVNDDINAVIDYEQDADGWAGILGINITPVDDLTLALRYESKTALEFKSKVNTDNFGLLPTLGVTDGGKSNRDLPALLGLGASYRIVPKMKLDINLTCYLQEGADWDGAEDKIDNGYDLGFAIEYTLDRATRASFGFMHTHTGMGNAALMTAEAPQLNADTLGAGLVQQYSSNIEMNFSLGKVFYETASYSYAGQEISYDKDIYFLALGGQYRF